MADMVPEGESRDGDIRARLVGVEKDVAAFVQRILEMERWRTKTDIEDARKDEQWSTMKARLDSIDSSVAWIVRLIGGAILLAIMAYLVKGGFALPHI